jgi:hypothetical protein
LWGNLAGIGNETATTVPEIGETVFIQGNSLEAPRIADRPKNVVLAYKGTNEYSNIIFNLSVKYKIDYQCFTAIVKEESGFNFSVCNFQYGCKSGQGLGQLIPSTVRNCERGLGMTIDPFIPEQNLECMAYLLARDGTHHWGYPAGDSRGYMKNGQRWGSYDRWSPYCK